MANIERYTLLYRINEARQVMEWVSAGQCGSVIGLPGAGKSNFLQFLLREDVKQHYLGQNSQSFQFILINLLSLAERTDWGVYELLLGSLAAQLSASDPESTVLAEISALHRQVLERRDALIAQRTFEHSMSLLSQQSALRLVFILDEFEDVVGDLPAALFKCLRALRDAHKEQVSFLVAATRELADLWGDHIKELKQFQSLVSRNACWLGPYGERDAGEMIGYVTARRRRTLSEEDIAGLIELSGGHAGLIKAILSLAWNRGYRSVSGLEPLRLVNEASVCSECRKIWESLPEREQAALCSLAAGELILRKSLFHLNERGLVKGTDNGPVFFSPLFKVFVEEQLPPPTQGTYIDRSIQIVQIAGKRIPGVESLEFEALCCLYEAHGRICTKDDLARSVYHQRYDNRQGVTDQMLHALISRLRRKIEPDPRHPKYVVTVRSEGYKFVMAGEGQ